MAKASVKRHMHRTLQHVHTSACSECHEAFLSPHLHPPALARLSPLRADAFILGGRDISRVSHVSIWEPPLRQLAHALGCNLIAIWEVCGDCICLSNELEALSERNTSSVSRFPHPAPPILPRVKHRALGVISLPCSTSC